MGANGVVDPLTGVLASLAVLDPETLDDQSVRGSVLAMLECANTLDAVIARFTRTFDDRKLFHEDGYNKTTLWLEAYARLSGPAASARVRAAGITRLLPSLEAAFVAGEVDAEHVNRIGLTADRVGADVVQEAEDILVPLAKIVDPDTLRSACNYLRDEALRDKSTPPERQYGRRGVTVSRINDMWHLSGLLDAETGTLLREALDAFSPAPIQGDDRSPAQRRHDALADLLNTVVRDGKAPANGGMRPHIGLLMPVRRYVDLHDHTGAPATSDEADAARAMHDRPSAGSDEVPFFPVPDDGNEPAVMTGWGPIPDGLAARLSCDAILQQLLLHPDNGLPLKLGRAYRNTPPALRRALAARDPECRWPGCRIPASWCDSHHLREWVRHHGDTDIGNLVILCRYHHVCVHERGWAMDRDPATGWITITRPDGRPYELGPSRPKIDGFRRGGGRPPPGQDAGAPDPPPE
ncbi:DUF222 domain-containing protein [Dactylosporangium siamense]|uniref:HNH nuclease domain-containing protein n=1 Tax=Dactylosporangium siamense TaxID=685454 RepID=A0A919PSB9_9ACTN|nr:HNH endonuclease signature motif containing protein [Dactylosporangium siamense]GIG49312.1 hypothetical protein Dsi01nite_073530 [Dactylosporangium siamense]